MDKKFVILDEDLSEHGGYSTEEAAARSASDLAAECPGSVFYVMKAVGFSKQVDTAPYTKYDAQPKTGK